MKFPYLTTILIGLALSSTTLTISEPAEASPDEYFCASYKGTYRTFARSPRGNMSLLNFERYVSEHWNPRRRCVEVSRRFQRFHDNGIKFIGSGLVNNEPVLCAVSVKIEKCNSDNVLVTLPPYTDHNMAARRLIDIRGLIRIGDIDVGGKKGKLATYINGNVYYDLEIVKQRIQQNSDRLIEEDLVPITDY
jgi:hypothetical protein